MKQYLVELHEDGNFVARSHHWFVTVCWFQFLFWCHNFVSRRHTYEIAVFPAADIQNYP